MYLYLKKCALNFSKICLYLYLFFIFVGLLNFRYQMTNSTYAVSYNQTLWTVPYNIYNPFIMYSVFNGIKPIITNVNDILDGRNVLKFYYRNQIK